MLVAPRLADVLQRDEAIAMASGATDVLRARPRRRRRSAEALDGVDLRLRDRDDAARLRPADRAPRELFAELAASGRIASRSCSAPSASACATTTSTRCHACLEHPDRIPRYGSLNLAQAVQLVAYDWRQALGGFAVEPRAPTPAPRRRASRCAACSRTGSGALAEHRLSRPGGAAAS